MKIINAVIAHVQAKKAARKERLYAQAQADAYALITSHDHRRGSRR